MSTTFGTAVKTTSTAAGPAPKRRRNVPLQGFGLLVVLAALITAIVLSVHGPTPKRQIVGSIELTGGYTTLKPGASCAGVGTGTRNLKAGALTVLYGPAAQPLDTTTLTAGVVTPVHSCLFAFTFLPVRQLSGYAVGIAGGPRMSLDKAQLKAAQYRFQFVIKNVVPAPAATVKK